MEAPLTVTQLNTRVKSTLNGTPGLNDVWVSGEISNLTKAASGHYYMTLKDEGSEIRCTMFKGARQRIDFEPALNMKVQVFGNVDLYVLRGTYQFIVSTMRRSGIGELYVRFEEMKRRLGAEGLFDQSRKRPLPRYPRTIGVVTSPTGAVIHDIITTSASRYPADIFLAPAMVQGEGAAATIVAGIELLNRVGVDVIIVGRGGGSLEDLWPFNEESVARAIAASEIPIVSAVGHETDFTIADMVADVRAPTPTGAAAMILRDRGEIRTQIDGFMASATASLGNTMSRMRGSFAVLDAKLSPETALRDLDMRSMGIDGLWAGADRALSDTLVRMRSRFSDADSRLSPERALVDIGQRASRLDGSFDPIERHMTGLVNGSASALATASARLESLNPTRVMERGYGIVLGEDGRAVTSVSGMLVGQRIDVRLRDGTARTTIREIREDRT